MKRYAALVLSIVFAISSVAAEVPDPQAAAAGSSKARKSPARKPAVDVSEQLAEMKAMLQQQQQQINDLKQQVQQRDQALQQTQQQMNDLQSAAAQAKTAAADAQAKASAIESSSTENKDTVSKLTTDVKDMQGNMTTMALQAQEEQKRASALEGLVGRFRFTGDVRVRQEDFFQSYSGCPSNGAACNMRARERIRARLGIEGRLNEDFVGGIALATGTVFDPTSTNETLTSAFEKKTFALDRGYITYNPARARWLTLTGGKFAFSWIKTNQTFDPDLNPEGFSEKLSFDVKGSKFFKNVTFTGIQLFYNETNRPVLTTSTGAPGSGCVVGSQFCTNGNNTTGGDSFAVGGQASTKLQITKRWAMTPSYTILNWRNDDTLLNQPSTVTGNTGIVVNQGPPVSAAPISTIFAPNGLTNATITVGTTGGQTIRSYYSQYLYSDLIIDNTITTKWAKFPIRILGEYLDNLNAQDHPLFAFVNGASSGTACTGPTAGCVATNLGKQSHVYRGEFTMGQQRNKGDWLFTYAFHRQEQDSVLANFNESDQRAPTNILQHMFIVGYRVRNNTTIQYTQWIGRTLNSALQNSVVAPGITAGQQEPYLKRAQFDVVYTF
jgi:hypothetical protein